MTGNGNEELAVFPEGMRVLLVCVNKTYRKMDLYHAARYSWPIRPEKARQAEYVMAVFEGTIVGVFKAEEWLPAKKDNFPGLPPGHGNWDKQKGRFGFVGCRASKDIEQPYLNKGVPKEWRFRGIPVRYVNF